MSFLSFLQQFSHKSEMRESEDEIMLGEIIYLFSKRGWPMVELQANSDLQQVEFRCVDDPVVHRVQIRLDRKTGTGIVSQMMLGSKATFRMTVETKNLTADPDDLLEQWSTDLKNIAKIPILGQIKVNHDLNSVFATKGTILEIRNYILGGAEHRKALDSLLSTTFDELKSVVKPYKRSGS